MTYSKLSAEKPTKLLVFKNKQKKKKFWVYRQNLFICGMLAIAVASFLLFYVYINFSSIILAFQSPIDSSFSFINFKNVINSLTNSDGELQRALVNTMYFFGSNLLITLPLSLFFSYFLYKKIKGYKIFSIVFFLPSIISAAVTTKLYGYMLEPSGFISKIFCEIFNLETPPTFLGQEEYALNTIIIYCIWTGFGVNIILFNGAMSRVPTEIIEYDKLEGVGFFKELVLVVIPLIWPTLSTILIFQVVGLFNSSGPILLFTEGRYNTFTISFWIYDQVVNKGSFEYASAVGLFFAMIGLPLTLFVKWIMGKIGSDIEY